MLTRQDLEERLASAARAARHLAPPRAANLLAAHLRDLLDAVQAGPIAEGPRAVGDVLADHPALTVTR